MAQPDAAWLAECAHSYGHVPAALFATRLGEVSAGLQQEHQQQLNAGLAAGALQHQQQLAAAQQQHQAQLAAVHQQLAARTQELAASNQALAAVRVAVEQVELPAAGQQAARGVSPEPAANVDEAVHEELEANEPEAHEPAAAAAHVAADAEEPPAKRARADSSEADELRDAENAYSKDTWGVISRDCPPVS
jgi:hypothetical protein